MRCVRSPRAAGSRRTPASPAPLEPEAQSTWPPLQSHARESIRLVPWDTNARAGGAAPLPTGDGIVDCIEFGLDSAAEPRKGADQRQRDQARDQRIFDRRNAAL